MREVSDDIELFRPSEIGCATSGTAPELTSPGLRPLGDGRVGVLAPALPRRRENAPPRERSERTDTASASKRRGGRGLLPTPHPGAVLAPARGDGESRLPAGPGRWRRVSVDSSSPLKVSCSRRASASTSSISFLMSRADTSTCESSSSESLSGWRTGGVATAPRNADGGPLLAPTVAKRRDAGVAGDCDVEEFADPARRRLLLERRATSAGPGLPAPIRMDVSLVFRPSSPPWCAEP